MVRIQSVSTYRVESSTQGETRMRYTTFVHISGHDGEAAPLTGPKAPLVSLDVYEQHENFV